MTKEETMQKIVGHLKEDPTVKVSRMAFTAGLLSERLLGVIIESRIMWVIAEAQKHTFENHPDHPFVWVLDIFELVRLAKKELQAPVKTS